MKARFAYAAVAIIIATALSSCGAANSIYETADRAVQAVGRSALGY